MERTGREGEASRKKDEEEERNLADKEDSLLLLEGFTFRAFLTKYSGKKKR